MYTLRAIKILFYHDIGNRENPLTRLPINQHPRIVSFATTITWIAFESGIYIGMGELWHFLNEPFYKFASNLKKTNTTKETCFNTKLCYNEI